MTEHLERLTEVGGLNGGDEVIITHRYRRDTVFGKFGFYLPKKSALVFPLGDFLTLNDAILLPFNIEVEDIPWDSELHPDILDFLRGFQDSRYPPIKEIEIDCTTKSSRILAGLPFRLYKVVKN